MTRINLITKYPKKIESCIMVGNDTNMGRLIIGLYGKVISSPV